jgi:hypothetical protein
MNTDDMTSLEEAMMTTCDPLVLDLVQWVAREPRTYAEVLDAWKTSCPRLTVWEDAVDLGYVTRRSVGARGTIVVLTGAGHALLAREAEAAEAALSRLPRRRREADSGDNFETRAISGISRTPSLIFTLVSLAAPNRIRSPMRWRTGDRFTLGL